jgi:chromosome segregation ATPase
MSPISKKSSVSSSSLSSSAFQELDLLRNESQKQERKNMIHQRLLEESSKRIGQLNKELNNRDLDIQRLETALVNSQQRTRNVEEEKNRTIGLMDDLRHELHSQKELVETLQQELHHMKQQYLSGKKDELAAKVNTPISRPKKPLAPNSRQIVNLFDRLNELGMVDQKYATLLNKLKTEIEVRFLMSHLA